MTEVKIPDDGGDTLTHIEHNGYLFPNFPDARRSATGLSSVYIWENDVLLLGFPKSGNHWLWELSRQILAGHILEDDMTMMSMFMDRTPEEEYANIESPRILTSHTLLPQLPADVVKIKPKIINVVRNPKDVAVSFYTFMTKLPYMHYGGKWENLMKPFFHGKFCYGSWMNHVIEWEKVKADYPYWPILTLYYEDVVEDTLREVKKLSRFLEVERSDEYLDKVCKKCSIDSMRKDKLSPELKTVVFRKGKVGDWKNWFTVAQNEWFDQLYQEKMKDCQLTFRYTLDS